MYLYRHFDVAELEEESRDENNLTIEGPGRGPVFFSPSSFPLFVDLLSGELFGHFVYTHPSIQASIHE